jgi:hypothetical protein
MEHLWDLLFQLVKHGINTLHVGFIFLFSVVYWEDPPALPLPVSEVQEGEDRGTAGARGEFCVSALV